MKDLVISVSQQIDGYNFSLSPKMRKEMSALFPHASLLPHIFISYESKLDFEGVYDRVEKHILPFLTGVELNELAKYFDRVVFLDNDSNTRREIALNAYVEENKLVLG